MAKITNPNTTQVPNIIFDYWMERLTPAEFKVLFLLASKAQIYPLTVKQIKKNTGLTKTCVNKCLKTLFKNNLVSEKPLNEDSIIVILSTKSSIKLRKDVSDIYTCFWCHGESYILHKHHYPIQRKHDGAQIIEICANCHCEFHELLDTKRYQISEEVLNG